MASEGPNSPSTGAQSGSDVSWINPGTIIGEGGGNAICAMAPMEISNLLYGEDFGFSIPGSATIGGIEVEWYIRDAGGGGSATEDQGIFIRKGGVEGLEDKAVVGLWPVSFTYRSYGGAADLWSETWSPSDINASNFGAHLYAYNSDPVNNTNSQVDHVRITVTFTEPTYSFVSTIQTEQPQRQTRYKPVSY